MPAEPYTKTDLNWMNPDFRSSCYGNHKKCDKKLVVRAAQKGEYKGNKFWGCTGYPNCKYIENM